MHTTRPRGSTASPGRRPARLVGAVLAALSASLVFVGSGFAATTAEAPYTDAPVEVTQPAPETPPPTTDPVTTDGTVTDGTTVTDPAPAPTDGSVTEPGIYVPDPVVPADPAAPPVTDPAPAPPVVQVPTVVPVVVPSGPDAVPGVTDHTIVVPFKPDAPVTAGTATTTGRDSTATPQVWSAPAVPAVPDAPEAAVKAETTVIPVRPEPLATAKAPAATPPSFTPDGRLVDVVHRAAPVAATPVAREVPTVRAASPESLDGAPPPELRTPGITYSGGTGGLLEVLAGYVFPGAANTQSGAILLLFPLALLLAGLLPRLPRLHLQGIVSESGAGARGYDPVALRPG